MIPTRAAKQAYANQRKGAFRRGVEWRFAFDGWCRVWEESGKWGERGRTGYVMARKGDVGPYSPDNVYITTVQENSRDAWRNTPIRSNRPPVKKAGGGRGYSFRPDQNKAKPYAVRCAGKWIGCYATENEAVSAYANAAQARRAAVATEVAA